MIRRILARIFPRFMAVRYQPANARQYTTKLTAVSWQRQALPGRKGGICDAVLRFGLLRH